MKNWFSSSRGALTLSFLSLLTLLARSHYDTRFILTEDYSPFMPGIDSLWIFGSTAAVGVNIWALVAAGQGRRWAWYVLLAFNLVFNLGFGAYSLLKFMDSRLELTIFASQLVAGLLAAISVGMLRRGSRSPQPRAA